ncbi:MAG TPA: SDR family oxidoreductase [Thermomicrobiaceae bacterium]|nr:SDR family oxidoreductase [Thermomicrobiaceae bacterium]
MMQDSHPMAGRVCVITGATSGLGQVTARRLAELGAEVVVVGRDAAKCAATAERITRETGNAAVSWLRADLSSQREVAELARQLQQRGGPIHVLLNNAGVIVPKRQLSVDGIELTLATNYLGPFLLTNLLLDELKASAPARVVNVCSVSHANAEIDFADLGLEQRYRGFKAYGRSKLALLLFTYELARRLEGTGVTVNAANPGLVWTKLGQHSLSGRISQRLVHLRYRKDSVSPEEGARSLIYLASSAEVEGVSGTYVTGEEAGPSSPRSYDRALAERLWQESLELTKPRPAPA